MGYNDGYGRPADYSASTGYMGTAVPSHLPSTTGSVMAGGAGWHQHQSSGSPIVNERELQRQLAREKRQQQEETGEASMSYVSKPRSTLPPQYPPQQQQQQQPYSSVGRTQGSHSPKRSAPYSSSSSSSSASSSSSKSSQDSFKKQRILSVPEKSHVNLLKQPSEFRGQVSFFNTLPPVALAPKLLNYRDRYDTETRPDELIRLRNEQHTPFIVERTLGVVLDLVDLAVFRPTPGCTLDPKDEEILQMNPKKSTIAATSSSSSPATNASSRGSRLLDDDVDDLIETTKLGGSKKPNGKKPASLRKAVEDVAALIEESFEAAKHPPTHATNPSLLASEIWPVLPQIDLWPEVVESVMFDTDPLPPTLTSEAFGQCVLDMQQRRCVRFCAPSSLTPHQQDQINGDGQGQLLEDTRAYEELPQRDEEPEYLIAISDLQAGYVAVRKHRKLKRPNIEEIKRLRETKRNIIVLPRELATSERERRDHVLHALLPEL